jgi:hypothetical protein
MMLHLLCVVAALQDTSEDESDPPEPNAVQEQKEEDLEI